MDNNDARIAIFALNNFGAGGHPIADRDNLEFFAPAYLQECLNRVLASPAASNQAKRLARRLLEAASDE
jgi:hypothetical protein